MKSLQFYLDRDQIVGYVIIVSVPGSDIQILVLMNADIFCNLLHTDEIINIKLRYMVSSETFYHHKFFYIEIYLA